MLLFAVGFNRRLFMYYSQLKFDLQEFSRLLPANIAGRTPSKTLYLKDLAFGYRCVNDRPRRLFARNKLYLAIGREFGQDMYCI